MFYSDRDLHSSTKDNSVLKYHNKFAVARRMLHFFELSTSRGEVLFASADYVTGIIAVVSISITLLEARRSATKIMLMAGNSFPIRHAVDV